MADWRLMTDWRTWTICAAIGLSWLFMLTQLPHAFDPLDDAASDWLLTRQPDPTVDDELVLVMIDDDTFELLDEQPVTRATHAELLRLLAEAGVRQVSWDAIFRSASVDDKALIAAMRQIPTVLACEGSLWQEALPGNRDALPPQAWLSPPERAWWPFPPYRLGLVPQPSLAAAANGIGHISETPDRDGVLRRLPLIVRVGERYLPASVLATALGHLGLDQDDVRYDPASRLLTLGDDRAVIPLDDQHAMRLNPIKQLDLVDHRSYGRLLQSLRFDPTAMRQGLAGKTVLIGPAYTGSGDFVTAPHGPGYPGVLALFAALNTITTGQPIMPAPAALSGVLMLLLVVCMGLISSLSRPLPAALMMLAVVLLAALGIGLTFRYTLVLVPPAIPLGAAATSALALITYSRYRTYRRAARLAERFSRYLPPALRRHLALQPQPPAPPSGERLEITVLAAELSGFREWASQQEPEPSAKWLSRFYAELSAVIDGEQGMLVSLRDDRLVAIWGAPVVLDTPETGAIAAVRELRHRLAQLSSDSQPIRLRAGLASGEALVGSLGDHHYSHFSALGPPVELAEQLLALAEPDDILVDDATASFAEAGSALVRHKPATADQPPLWRLA